MNNRRYVSFSASETKVENIDFRPVEIQLYTKKRKKKEERRRINNWSLNR